MMTKADYIIIANRIRSQYDAATRRNEAGQRIASATTIALQELVLDLCASFRADNPKFDTRKFHVAALGHVALLPMSERSA